MAPGSAAPDALGAGVGVAAGRARALALGAVRPAACLGLQPAEGSQAANAGSKVRARAGARATERKAATASYRRLSLRDEERADFVDAFELRIAAIRVGLALVELLTALILLLAAGEFAARVLLAIAAATLVAARAGLSIWLAVVHHP